GLPMTPKLTISARLNDHAADLTRVEFTLLNTLSRWPGRVFSGKLLTQMGHDRPFRSVLPAA
ncbi:MAG: hypothetical protein RQ826_06195, partial [Xanthomonadales bacterium]|nr:hypothetical protein [Xanthomonadales bacterium]